MNVRFRISVILLLAAVFSTGPGRAEDRPGTGGELPRLNMEELEVRGKRGNPDVLYSRFPRRSTACLPYGST